MKRVLMIAFHFPPCAVSSGIQRTLRFVQHLPQFGWEPIVLTAHPRAYTATGDGLLAEIPDGVVVERAQAWDAARHLAIKGHYPAFLARPDRWVTWYFSAVTAGRRLIERLKPQAIWSTFPIPTAHSIGLSLRRSSRLPWIADYRDPMVQVDYPADMRTWRSYARIEAQVAEHANFSVFCTAGAARQYAERYPSVARERLRVVENGYDEEAFARVESRLQAIVPLTEGATTLLHSGIVYRSERDPTFLFQALRQLKAEGLVHADRFRVRFRGSTEDTLLKSLAVEYGVDDLVELKPLATYSEAIEEMLRADGLLLLQAANCNDQIPAKLYEYVRARRPILGLTDAAGETAAALRRAGVEAVARLDSADEIAALLRKTLSHAADGARNLPSTEAVLASTRRARSRELATLLDEAIR